MIDSIIFSANLVVVLFLMIVCLFVVMTVSYLIGKRHRRKKEALSERREKTAGTITGASLALLGFIMAVSLSMADSNFQARRKLILDEANAISTSALRARAIGGDHGREIVRLLGNYTRLRLDFFAAGEDRNRLKTVYEQTGALQNSVWNHASAIAQAAPTNISGLLLSSLNETFDLGTSRRWILEVRIPPYVIKLLILFSLLSMAIMGYYFGICGVYHPFLSGLLFFALTFIILLIMDLDRPRSGYITPEQSPLTWLLEESKPPEPAGSLGQ
jgi:hypothetical protein